MLLDRNSDAAPITVPASPLSPLMLTLLRYALTALGTVMVSRGLIDQGSADALAGAALIAIPTLWGMILTRRDQAQKARMAERLPDGVAVVK